MKWLFAIACIAVLCDLAAGDPMRLRNPDFAAMTKVVRDIGYHLERGEFLQIFEASSLKQHAARQQSSLTRKPH